MGRAQKWITYSWEIFLLEARGCLQGRNNVRVGYTVYTAKEI